MVARTGVDWGMDFCGRACVSERGLSFSLVIGHCIFAATHFSYPTLRLQAHATAPRILGLRYSRNKPLSNPPPTLK